MSFDLFITRDVNFTPVGNSLRLDTAGARLRVIPDDRARLESLLTAPDGQEPVLVSFALAELGAALQTGIVDGMYTSDPNTVEAALGILGLTSPDFGQFDVLSFDRETGQLRPYDPEIDVAPPAPPPDPVPEDPTPENPPPPAIDPNLAEGGGPYSLLLDPALGVLYLSEIDGATVAVTGEAQRQDLLDLLADTNVQLDIRVFSSFSETLANFNAGGSDLLLVPQAALLDAAPPAGLTTIQGLPATGTQDGQPIEAVVVDRSGAPMEGALVTFTLESGAGVDSVATGANGRATLNMGGDEAGRAIAKRAYGPDDPDITATSALEALRLAVGLPPSWGTAHARDFIAADFNGDGQVTALDALGILRIAVGLTDQDVPRWVFVDENADLSAIDRNTVTPEYGVALGSGVSEFSLVGILVGNVQEYV